MIKAIVVEDEMLVRKNLQNMLVHYCPNVNLVGEADGLKSGIKAIKEQKPELVFLDINFGDGKKGFDLLDHFPKADFSVIITTAYEMYALRAFEYNAIDYLVKPIDPDKLVRAVDKAIKMRSVLTQEQISQARQTMKDGQLQQIVVSTMEGLNVIRFGELKYIRSSGNLTTFYLQSSKRVMTTTFTMVGLMQVLPKQQFFRTKQSYIVNREYVTGFMHEEGATMKDGERIPVARSKQRAFAEWLKG